MAPASESTPERPPIQAVSLSELTEAFAQAMGIPREAEAEPAKESRPEVQGESAAATAEETDQTPRASGEERQPGSEENPCPIGPQSILEAMLFVGSRDNQPLSGTRAAEVMRGVVPEEVPRLVDDLNRRYAAAGCCYQIVHQGQGYRMTLRKAFHPLRNRFYGRIREARLSQAAVDVLAIVAYQQPLGGDEISRLRGRPSSHVLAQLVRRGLLRIERKDPQRRGAQFVTTDRFLELFGLQSLADLPQSEELDRQ